MRDSHAASADAASLIGTVVSSAHGAVVLLDEGATVAKLVGPIIVVEA